MDIISLVVGSLFLIVSIVMRLVDIQDNNKTLQPFVVLFIAIVFILLGCFLKYN